jgi:hypothetical protein
VYEIFAIATGVVVGLAVQNMATTQLKVATLILGSAIVGDDRYHATYGISLLPG